jgi:tRNA A58 N-methylase Trm61
MARAVGPTGKIYAVDIQQEMLDLLMKNMAKRRVQEIVKPILGTIRDPKLPPASCDTMIMVDVYHEFDHPYEMIEQMFDHVVRSAPEQVSQVNGAVEACRAIWTCQSAPDGALRGTAK